MKHKRIMAAVLSAAMCLSSLILTNISFPKSEIITEAASISDIPTDYQYAADWIWNTRIIGEGSVVSHDTIYDQIIAGKGTLNYIVRWQSYKNITLQQRKQLQTVIETAVNDWNKWLAGYENWPYEHVNVKIVGWAVLDKNSLLDLQSDEKVYTDVEYYDPSGDINAGMANSTMPSLMPKLPVELYRYEHWSDANYQYPGGYENRFDMHLTGSTGMIDMGGYGYYWGQQLSDNAVLGLADGTTSVHILEHEIGHGFGFTDFYGGEGESDGFPPGGFPGGSSIMMAGSSSVITEFDGWFARYVWTKISAESGRFDLSDTQTTTQPETESVLSESFTDTITEVGNGYVVFAEHGKYYYDDSHYGTNEANNIAYYEVGDKINISFSHREGKIITVNSLELIYNSHDPEKLKGDVNADGVVNVADIVLLQNWFLNVSGIYLPDWKAADMNEDDVLNVLDLCFLGQGIISSGNI